MKKRTPEKFWFPWWPDKWIFGSIRIEFTPAERGIWVDLLSLASKDDGHIRANEETPYPIQQISGMLVIPERKLKDAIEKFIKKEKLTRLKTGTLYVTKWEKYQFGERHRRRIKAQMSGKSAVAAGKKAPILKDSIKKKIKRKKKIEYTPAFLSFYKEYPKQTGQKVAFTAWREHPKKNHNELIEAAKNYYQKCKYLKTGLEFIKDASGFIRLSKEYWKDFLKPVTPIKSKRDPDKIPEVLWRSIAAVLFRKKSEQYVSRFYADFREIWPRIQDTSLFEGTTVEEKIKIIEDARKK